MPRNPSEQDLLEEFEIARMQHELALLYILQVIQCWEEPTAITPGPIKAAVLQTAFRKLQDAEEVYDMVLLALTDYLRCSGLQIPAFQGTKTSPAARSAR